MGQNKNGAATRTALYESARHCFYQKGYFATSVRDIIQNANSKLGLFSYHFKSKDAIAVMVFRQYVEDTSRTLYQAMGRKLDTCDLLLNDILNYLSRLLRCASSHPSGASGLHRKRRHVVDELLKLVGRYPGIRSQHPRLPLHRPQEHLIPRPRVPGIHHTE